jgi:hypothetical protein
MKKFIFLMLMIMTSTMAVAVNLQIQTVPDIRTFDQAKMGTVSFDHNIHCDVTCTTCHHTKSFDTCSTCHTSDSEVNSKTAFHDNCKGCHKEVNQGPTKCKECHIK